MRALDARTAPKQAETLRKKLEHFHLILVRLQSTVQACNEALRWFCAIYSWKHPSSNRRWLFVTFIANVVAYIVPWRYLAAMAMVQLFFLGTRLGWLTWLLPSSSAPQVSTDAAAAATRAAIAEARAAALNRGGGGGGGGGNAGGNGIPRAGTPTGEDWVFVPGTAADATASGNSLLHRPAPIMRTTTPTSARTSAAAASSSSMGTHYHTGDGGAVGGDLRRKLLARAYHHDSSAPLDPTSPPDANSNSGSSSSGYTHNNTNNTNNNRTWSSSSNTAPPPLGWERSRGKGVVGGVDESAFTATTTTTTLRSSPSVLRRRAASNVSTMSMASGSSSSGSNGRQKEVCSGCQRTFGLLKRRTYCRHCGDGFCSSCCKYRVPRALFGATSPQAAREKVAVCEGCKKILETYNTFGDQNRQDVEDEEVRLLSSGGDSVESGGGGGSGSVMSAGYGNGRLNSSK